MTKSYEAPRLIATYSIATLVHEAAATVTTIG